MKMWMTAFLTGALFGFGLGMSGMAQPGIVLGFLDVTGNWNPSLMAVMGGAIGVNLPAYQWLFRRAHPLFSARFQLPAKHRIDRKLLLGSAIFGIGWGLSGYCPGTGIVAVSGGAIEALAFTGAMLVGFLVFNRRPVTETPGTSIGETP